MSTTRATTARRVLRAVFGVGVAAGVGMTAWGLIPAPAAPVPAATFDLRPTTSSAPEPTRAAAATPTPMVLEPSRLTIPSLDIDAPVLAERVTADGELVVPGDPSILASWRQDDRREESAAASRPNGLETPTGGVRSEDEAGSTAGVLVVAGHVDMRGDLGALHPLANVSPGAEVVLTGDSGEVERWRVDGLEVRAKDDLPDFAGGPRRLAIVTCAGPVVSTGHGRGYRDNLIAWATPL